MKVTYEEIKSLLNVVDTESTRYAMDAVRVTEDFLEATDGKMIVRVRPHEHREFKPALLGRKFLEDVKKAFPRKKKERAKGARIDVKDDCYGLLEAFVGESRIEGNQAEGHYPPTDSLVKPLDAYSAVIPLGVPVFLDLLTAAHELGIDVINLKVQIGKTSGHISGETDESEDLSGHSLTGVVCFCGEVQ